MFSDLADQIPVHFEVAGAATTSASLLAWVALVYLVMALGARSGELVWSGAHVGRLPAEQRMWSFVYALILLASGLVLLELTGVLTTGLLEDRWLTSAGFVVVGLTGCATLVALFKGSTWERMLFLPITLLGAGLAGWLTFG